jgi:hypothetical protein
MPDRDKIIDSPSGGGFKYIQMPSGKLYSFGDAIHAADLAETAFARAIHRAFELRSDWPGQPERAAYIEMDYESIEWALDSMESYIVAARERLDKERGVKSQEERIALLRNTSGRTPEEAEAFQKKADELERKLKA